MNITLGWICPLKREQARREWESEFIISLFGIKQHNHQITHYDSLAHSGFCCTDREKT